MKNAIIVHGMPDKDHYYKALEESTTSRDWIPWLRDQLLANEILAQAPEMPHPYLPKYDIWKEVFEYFPIKNDTVLVGHSCGGGFLVRYLSENKINAGNVILVAPWLNTEHYLENLDPGNTFFDFDIDPTLTDRVKLTVMYSTDDDDSILDTIKLLQEKLPNANYIQFTDRGHFTTEPGFDNDTFPELLAECLK